MSIVAVKIEQNHITIGADSGDIWGDTKLSTMGNKLWAVSDVLFAGSVGSAALGSLFRYYLAHLPPIHSSEDYWLRFALAFKKHTEQHGMRMDDNSFITVHHGRVWRINGLHVNEVTTFDVIGAGRPYALAALALGHSVEKAVAVACDLCIHCASPITLLRMQRKEALR
jgi:ATP-dependent protease HslVU (ClpYQ) peptidase subunit